MNLNKLKDYLNPKKDYLLSSESDVKYLMQDAFIKGIQILVKNRVVIIMADKLVMDTVKDKVEDEYEMFDLRSSTEIAAAFEGLNKLVVDAADTSLKNQKFLLSYGIKKLLPENGILTELRNIKSAEEIELLRESQSINIEAFEAVKSLIKVGMTEEEISRLIKIKHLEFGASTESFEPIVAFNENGANPHHINGDNKRLTEKDQILIDMGGIYKGYCSDMTRVIFMDKAPEEQIKLYELVKDVTYKCLEFGKIGMTYRQMYDKANELLGENKELFTHSLSHGIGIDVHEVPLGSAGFDMKIEKGHVFSIEPGIYFKGKYGYRYEIVAVATEDGLIELK